MAMKKPAEAGFLLTFNSMPAILHKVQLLKESLCLKV
jgi:hypothetical protein